MGLFTYRMAIKSFMRHVRPVIATYPGYQAFIRKDITLYLRKKKSRLNRCYIYTFLGLTGIQHFKQELKTGGKAFDLLVLKASKPDFINVEDLREKLVQVFLDCLEANIIKNGFKNF
ncbi:hypothetical protein ACVWYG_003447 [Pedobacter sp. UYEF25]